MGKLGVSYEAALHDIVGLLKPGKKVEHGVWLDGPDGAREIDVLVEGQSDGAQIKLLLECKDYNRKRRLGVGTVDAFDSKLRDLGATGGVICSNADFTKPARMKAKRLGIGLIAILKDADGVGYDVRDICERREVQGTVDNSDLRFSFKVPVEATEGLLDAPLFWSNSLRQIAAEVFLLGVIGHPIVNGRPQFSCRLRPPWDFEFNGKNALCELVVAGSISGAWLRKEVRIDGTKALYDWLRRTVILPPGTTQVTYRDATFDKPEFWAKTPVIADQAIGFTPGVSLHSNLGLSGFAKSPPSISDVRSRISLGNVRLLNPGEALKTSVSRKKYQAWYDSRAATK